MASIISNPIILNKLDSKTPPPGDLIQLNQSSNQNPPQPIHEESEISKELSNATAETWLSIASLAESINDPEKAATAYDATLRHQPTNTTALTNLANLYRSRDMFGKAAELYQRSLAINAENGDTWGLLGHCYLMLDDLQRAYAAYQQALYHLGNPNVPKLWHGIGILYDRYGSLEYAEEAFARVLELDPNFYKSSEIYFRLGIIYKHQGKLTQALECFKYILSNPPTPLTQPDVWFQIGSVLEQQRDYTQARDAYERVLVANPRHAKVLQQLGCLYSQQGSNFQDLSISLKLLTQSLELDSNDAHTWYHLGRIHMSRADYPQAYDSFQQAVNRDSRNPTFWCSIGVLYYQISQYRDALDAYTRAIRLNPYISEVWYDLGTLYETCNNQIGDALDAYKQAMRLDPSNQAIKKRLDQLIEYQENGGSANGATVPLSQQPRLPSGMLDSVHSNSGNANGHVLYRGISALSPGADNSVLPPPQSNQNQNQNQPQLQLQLQNTSQPPPLQNRGLDNYQQSIQNVPQNTQISNGNGNNNNINSSMNGDVVIAPIRSSPHSNIHSLNQGSNNNNNSQHGNNLNISSITNSIPSMNTIPSMNIQSPTTHQPNVSNGFASITNPSPNGNHEKKHSRNSSIREKENREKEKSEREKFERENREAEEIRLKEAREREMRERELREQEVKEKEIREREARENEAKAALEAEIQEKKNQEAKEIEIKQNKERENAERERIAAEETNSNKRELEEKNDDKLVKKQNVSNPLSNPDDMDVDAPEKKDDATEPVEAKEAQPSEATISATSESEANKKIESDSIMKNENEEAPHSEISKPTEVEVEVAEETKDEEKDEIKEKNIEAPLRHVDEDEDYDDDE